ncbi:MAG TPA: C10 family peptidase [Chitinophagales bacterium]|nr:C10 family peptidase [Chitinophagales bacterium]
MKNKIVLLTVATMLLAGFARAGQVSVQNAQNIAINYFKLQSPANIQGTLSATLKYTATEPDNSVDFYVFDVTPGPGFVIVSGYDNVIPVLAYSNEGFFNTDFQKRAVNSWIKTTQQKIQWTQHERMAADARISNLWTSYTEGHNPNATRAGSVGPLLTTTWDQEPYYNALCPYNNTDQQRTVTGCVATAMAQIMKYWSYPAQGKGSHSYTDAPPYFSSNYGTLSADFASTIYRWTNMPANVHAAGTSVDTLMYHCGVSVEMDYGDDNEGGSGAWVLQSEAGNNQPCAQYSYINYFSYNPNTIQGVVMSHYSSANWMSLMQGDLDAGRVIQYEGDDVNGGGGHTWVCDGYNSSNQLHMNWGWSGSDNGYFAVTNLNASPYNFTDNEAALIGIEPLSPINVIATAIKASVCPGGSTTISAQGPSGATYSWTPTTGLTCASCATTTVTPTGNTIYTVTVDSAGVTGTATVSVGITSSPVAAFSVNATATCSVPAAIAFGNTSSNATSYMWYFGDGATDTSSIPLHIYNTYGNYTVKLVALNGCSTDSLVQTSVVHINNQTPVSPGASICPGQTASLTATGNGFQTWYSTPTGGSPVAIGSSYTTPALNTNTTYYVSSTIAAPVNAVGPASNSLGNGGYFTNTNQHAVIFNCSIPQTLQTVDVYAQSAGTRIIQLQDSNGHMLDSVHVNIPTGHSTITLNMPIPAEEELELAISGTINLYRNSSGANYPYTSTDGSVVLTNSDAGTAGYFYFFYNWQLQQGPCVTDRVPVVVNVLGTGTGSFTTTANGADVSFSPSNTSATDYTWNFGDGGTSTQQSPSHMYSGSGTYTVQLIESNGTCTDTVTQTVTVQTTGIDNAGTFGNISLYPNPAKQQLSLHITTATAIGNCGIEITNLLGDKIISQNLNLNAGNNEFSLDVSSLSQGVYFITMHSGGVMITRRFIKAE